MKQLVKRSMLMVMLMGLFISADAQNVGGYSAESYVKRNISLEKFKFLGVNQKQYARCVESVNYLEPAKKLVFTVIDKTEFVDDGQGFDLVANDGIMTSKTLFAYAENEPRLPAGQYLPVKNEQSVHDADFAHVSSSKFGITCDLVWVSCNTWPPNYQALCRELTWPSNGNLELRNCRVVFSFL